MRLRAFNIVYPQRGVTGFHKVRMPLPGAFGLKGSRLCLRARSKVLPAATFVVWLMLRTRGALQYVALSFCFLYLGVHRRDSVFESEVFRRRGCIWRVCSSPEPALAAISLKDRKAFQLLAEVCLHPKP